MNHVLNQRTPQGQKSVALISNGTSLGLYQNNKF